ncbi:MAG: DNA polymerase III subunit delta [Clostridia bacterium]|nr:DNA polymerase III subunit delta [Clostridia bacterium]
MKFINMNKELKENIVNVYNIKGDDFYLIRQAIKNLKAILIQELEEFNYIKIDADKMKTNEFNAIISALPMINEYRLVVVDNINSELVKFLNNYVFDDSGVVVACINADKLDAEIIDCSALDRADIAKYILNYCAKNGLSIEERALDYFIEVCGGQMSKIVNELAKLSAYVMDEKIITMDIINNLVSNSQDYAIYMLTNAIDNMDYNSYQKIILEMSKSQSMSELYSFMGKHFKRMQYIALNKNDEELSRILGIKPYAIKLSRQSIAKNGMKYYLDLYAKYIDLDYKIKSGKITPQNALYSLIF